LIYQLSAASCATVSGNRATRRIKAAAWAFGLARALLPVLQGAQEHRGLVADLGGIEVTAGQKPIYLMY